MRYQTYILLALGLMAGCSTTSTKPKSTPVAVAAEGDSGAAVPQSRSLVGMTRVPLIVTGQNSALVNCTLNGKPIVLILDTGAQGTTIDLRVALAAGVKTTEVPGHFARGIGAGVVQTRASERIVLNMSGFEAHLYATLQDFSGLTIQHLQTGKTPIVGLLGFDVLRGYGAVIDLQEGAMYLRKR